MSVDTVNYALTKVRRSIELHPGSYSETGSRLLLLQCAVLRDHLLHNNAELFNEYLNQQLAINPDATVFLMEELYGELGLDEQTATREDLDAALAAA